MSQSTEIYNNYLKTFKDVVKPVISKTAPNVDGEVWADAHLAPRVGYAKSLCSVQRSNRDRICEVEMLKHGQGHLYFLFENEADWRAYRAPMGAAQYLWG